MEKIKTVWQNIKVEIEKYFTLLKKIPPWQDLLGGILVIIILSSPFSVILSTKPDLVVERADLEKKLTGPEKTFWLAFYDAASISKLELREDKAGRQITVSLIKERRDLADLIAAYTNQTIRNLKLLKRKNLLRSNNNSEAAILLKRDLLAFSKNLSLADIYQQTNLSLDTLFGQDNLEVNLSPNDKTAILKFLAAIKQLEILPKDKKIINFSSLDYFGVLDYGSQDEIKELEKLLAKITSLSSPEEKTKALLDGTSTIELVSRPEKFNFNKETYLEKDFFCQKNEKSGWQFCYFIEKNKLHFTTNLGYLKNRLIKKSNDQWLVFPAEINFLEEDKILVLDAKLTSQSQLLKHILPQLDKFSYLAIVELDDVLGINFF